MKLSIENAGVSRSYLRLKRVEWSFPKGEKFLLVEITNETGGRARISYAQLACPTQFLFPPQRIFFYFLKKINPFFIYFFFFFFKTSRRLLPVLITSYFFYIRELWSRTLKNLNFIFTEKLRYSKDYERVLIKKKWWQWLKKK